MTYELRLNEFVKLNIMTCFSTFINLKFNQTYWMVENLLIGGYSIGGNRGGGLATLNFRQGS